MSTPPRNVTVTPFGKFDDLPLIRMRPGPTDDKLQAQSDAEHAIAVAEWMNEEEDIDYIPASEVRG
jgi:hypothetical protein